MKYFFSFGLIFFFLGPLEIFADISFSWSGALTENSFRTIVLEDVPGTEVELLVDSNSNFSRAMVSRKVKTDMKGLASLEIGGLLPGREYFYGFRCGGVPSKRLGRIRTPAKGPFSFSFALGACARMNDHVVYDKIAEKHPLFLLHTGDLHYANIGSTNEEDHTDAMREWVFRKNSFSRLLLQVPIAYVWDDHDFTGNDADASAPGRLAARLSYQKSVPHFPLHAGSGDVPIQQSFSVGRIRFILSDLRSEKSVGGSAMGAAQLAWFKKEVLKARDQKQLIAWVSSYSWYGDQKDNWGGHSEERKLLAHFFRDSGIENLMILSGDAHMVAVDSGENGDFCEGRKNSFRYPVFQAAGFANRGSVKGGSYSHGVFPNPEISETNARTVDGRGWHYTALTYGQYGIINIEDDGSEIRVRFDAYRVKGVSGEESPLTTYSFRRRP